MHRLTVQPERSYSMYCEAQDVEHNARVSTLNIQDATKLLTDKGTIQDTSQISGGRWNASAHKQYCSSRDRVQTYVVTMIRVRITAATEYTRFHKGLRSFVKNRVLDNVHKGKAREVTAQQLINFR